jgi:hypothetical protein
MRNVLRLIARSERQGADFGQNFRDLLFVHALEYKRIRTGSKEKVGEDVNSFPARKMLRKPHVRKIDRI